MNKQFNLNEVSVRRQLTILANIVECDRLKQAKENKKNKMNRDYLDSNEWRVAKGLCVTRDERQNLYVTRESYLKRNVIREYLNACDA